MIKKVGSLHIGRKSDKLPENELWAVVHACKTSHRERLGYDKIFNDDPNYVSFRDDEELFLNWVDAPTDKYYRLETFIEAMDFIDEHIGDREIFIHCDMGQSRSPSLAMIYMAKRSKELPDYFPFCLLKFKEMYPDFRPSGILRFMELNWDQLK